MNFIKNNLKLWLLASLTLGLAPFNPPHIVGKLQWLAGGAVGMKGQDWFDLLLHGFPWIFLFIALAYYIKDKVTQKLS